MESEHDPDLPIPLVFSPTSGPTILQQQQQAMTSAAEQRAYAVAKLKRAASLPRMKDGRRPPMHVEGVSEGEKSDGAATPSGDERGRTGAVAGDGENEVAVAIVDDNAQHSDVAATALDVEEDDEQTESFQGERDAISSSPYPRAHTPSRDIASPSPAPGQGSSRTKRRSRSRSRSRSRGSKDFKAAMSAAASSNANTINRVLNSPSPYPGTYNPGFSGGADSELSQDESISVSSSAFTSPPSRLPQHVISPIPSHYPRGTPSPGPRLLVSPFQHLPQSSSESSSSDTFQQHPGPPMSPVTPMLPTLQALQQGLFRSHSASAGRHSPSVSARNAAMHALTGGTEMYVPSRSESPFGGSSGGMLGRSSTVSGGERSAARKALLNRLNTRIGRGAIGGAGSGGEGEGSGSDTATTPFVVRGFAATGMGASANGAVSPRKKRRRSQRGSKQHSSVSSSFAKDGPREEGDEEGEQYQHYQPQQEQNLQQDPPLSPTSASYDDALRAATQPVEIVDDSSRLSASHLAQRHHTSAVAEEEEDSPILPTSELPAVPPQPVNGPSGKRRSRRRSVFVEEEEEDRPAPFFDPSVSGNNIASGTPPRHSPLPQFQQQQLDSHPLRKPHTSDAPSSDAELSSEDNTGVGVPVFLSATERLPGASETGGGQQMFPASPFATPHRERARASDDDEEEVIYPGAPQQLHMHHGPQQQQQVPISLIQQRILRNAAPLRRDMFEEREISWVAVPVPSIRMPIDDEDDDSDVGEDHEEEGPSHEHDRGYDSTATQSQSQSQFTQSIFTGQDKDRDGEDNPDPDPPLSSRFSGEYDADADPSTRDQNEESYAYQSTDESELAIDVAVPGHKGLSSPSDREDDSEDDGSNNTGDRGAVPLSLRLFPNGVTPLGGGGQRIPVRDRFSGGEEAEDVMLQQAIVATMNAANTATAAEYPQYMSTQQHPQQSQQQQQTYPQPLHQQQPMLPLSRSASRSGSRSGSRAGQNATDGPSISTSTSTWEKMKGAFSRSGSSMGFNIGGGGGGSNAGGGGRRSRSNSIVNGQRERREGKTESSVSRESAGGGSVGGESAVSGAAAGFGGGATSNAAAPTTPNAPYGFPVQISSSTSLTSMPSLPNLHSSSSMTTMGSNNVVSPTSPTSNNAGNTMNQTPTSPLPPASPADFMKYQDDAKLFPFPGIRKLEEQRKKGIVAAPPPLTTSTSSPDISSHFGAQDADGAGGVVVPIQHQQSFSSEMSMGMGMGRERKLSHQLSDSKLMMRYMQASGSSPHLLSSSSQSGIPSSSMQQQQQQPPFSATSSGFSIPASPGGSSKLPMTLTGVKQWLSKNNNKFFQPTSPPSSQHFPSTSATLTSSISPVVEPRSPREQQQQQQGPPKKPSLSELWKSKREAEWTTDGEDVQSNKSRTTTNSGSTIHANGRSQQQQQQQPAVARQMVTPWEFPQDSKDELPTIEKASVSPTTTARTMSDVEKTPKARVKQKTFSPEHSFMDFSQDSSSATVSPAGSAPMLSPASSSSLFPPPHFTSNNRPPLQHFSSSSSPPTPDLSSSLDDNQPHSTTASSSSLSSQFTHPTSPFTPFRAQGAYVLDRLQDNLSRVSNSPMWADAIDNPPRKLVTSSPVLQVVNSNTVKDRFLFLFNDLLIIAKPIIQAQEHLADPRGRDPGDRKFVVKSIVPLRQLRFSAERGEPVGAANGNGGGKVTSQQQQQPSNDPIVKSFIAQFSKDPDQAISFLFSSKKVRDDPVVLGKLLFRTAELDRLRLGEYLSQRTSRVVLKTFLDSFRLKGFRMDCALRAFFSSIVLQIRTTQDMASLEYLVDSVASRWYSANIGVVAFDKDLALRLARALVQLNELVHDERASGARHLTFDRFLGAFRRHDPRYLITDESLESMFTAIVQEKLPYIKDSMGYTRPVVPIVVKRPLPSRLTYKVQSEPVVIRIPAVDPLLTIELYGHDLVFDPPALSFVKSPEASFRVTGTSLGPQSMIMCRTGPNAQKYTGLQLGHSITVERAFMRHTFQVAFQNHRGIKRRHMFSVDDSLLRHQWIISLKRQIESAGAASSSSSSNTTGSLMSRAADDVAMRVLQETLIGSEEGSTSSSVAYEHSRKVGSYEGNGSSHRQQHYQQQNKERLSAHVRSKSRSQIYDQHGPGKFEPHQTSSQENDEVSDTEKLDSVSGPSSSWQQQPEGRVWTGRDIQMHCQQNSSIAMVLTILQVYSPPLEAA